jgi:DNA polymerase III subunit alpha
MTVTQVNLHSHSDGSFLDGLQTVKQMAGRIVEVGSDAGSITDHNEVNQHFAFQKAMTAQGLHPVLGIEADWVYDVQWTRDNLPYPSNRSHICLLAETDEGLSNIWKLATLAYAEQYRYNKPLITPELMREHSAGVWASDGCALTEMARAIQKGDEELARQHFSMLLDIYGNHFYSELHTFQFINPEPEDKLKWNGEVIPVTKANEIMRDLNQAKLRFATEMGVPLVVVNDSHHSRPEDWVDKDLVWKFSTHKKKGEEGDQEVEATLQKADHLMGGEEIYGWMAMHGIGREVVDQCIANSHAIAHSCHAEVRKTLDMPSLTGSATDDLKMLIAKVQQGFTDKVTKEGLPEDVYFRRVEEELSLIAAKGFPGYFLVVEDECEAAVSGRWAPYIKANAKLAPQLIGPGRGSAGGSLVAWLTGITSIDPIHYDLLFERFLAPGRKGLPDIDVDFPQSQRPGEKEYLSARYGHDHVCSIGTLSHSQPKGLLKDLARAMGIFDKAPGDVISMSKIVEQVKGIETEETVEGGEEAATWEQVVEAKGGELASWVRKYPELFANINRFYQATDGDGPIRNSGIHASGVVVANQPLLGAIPLRSRPKDGEPVTQLDMFEVEELGAVKLDILGLRHLDTLMQARNMVYERHGVWLDFRRDHLPQRLRGAVDAECPEVVAAGDGQVITFGYDHYADPEIWPQVANGGTAGFFQVESGLLTRAAAELKPQNERDVAALISIVRPGVKDAGLDKAYLQRRAGVEEVTYDHPLMEPITSETYGVLIYQEQLLRSVRDLANFTPDEASDLQKALSKKWMDKVVAFKEKFIDGCCTNQFYMDLYCLNEMNDYDEGKAREVALKIWSSIEASGRYAFNKCCSGACVVRLSASSQYGNGTMTVGDMWRRLNDSSRLEGAPCWYGCTHTGYKGQCQTCRVWRQKFRDSRRGLKGWSLGDDGRLHPNRIVDVHQNGVQPVWKVALEDGRSITTTVNHRHMTPSGWREVWELSTDDELLVCGEYEGQIYEPEKIRTTRGERGPRGYIDGGFLALKEWTEEQEWVCSEPGCTRSRESGDRIERAHLDGDRTYNEPSNLAMKCASHHKAYDYQINGRRVRGEKGYPVIPTKIVSIEPAGHEMTYDLEMADPYHSWVGNDIVTHNSHAVGYAVISTWEIWTKHYYPTEFIAALMATDSENINVYIREARRRGITILPPDVNESGRKFTLTETAIRYGLDTLHGLGDAGVTELLSKRPFASLEDLVERCDAKKGMGKTQVEGLIKIGAMEGWGSRHDLFVAYQDLQIWKPVADSVKAKKNTPELRAEHIAAWRAKHAGEQKYEAEFGAASVPDFDDEAVIYAIEQELVGNFVTSDPMDKYAAAISAVAIAHPSQIQGFEPKDEFVIGGQVAGIKVIKIKKEGRNKGRDMAFLSVDWNQETFEVTLFPDVYEVHKAILVEGAPVACAVIRDGRGCNLKYAQRLDQMAAKAAS